jgi:hypothetical protein
VELRAQHARSRSPSANRLQLVSEIAAMEVPRWSITSRSLSAKGHKQGVSA